MGSDNEKFRPSGGTPRAGFHFRDSALACEGENRDGYSSLLSAGRMARRLSITAQQPLRELGIAERGRKDYDLDLIPPDDFFCGEGRCRRYPARL